MTADDLCRWRAYCQLTQEQAAERLGLTWRMYSNYERGKSPIPLKIRLACAAVALGYVDYSGPGKKEMAESPDD
jgi:transcriptional regulator with XRE-family HTH domain